MAQGFQYRRRAITARLEAEERRVLQKLMTDVAAMLEPEEEAGQDPLAALVGIDERADVPHDPALRRLLPQGSTDTEQAQEFRRFTERGLRERKRAALARATMALDSATVTLDREGARDFAQALNDVRLVLAQRLGVEDEADARRVAEVTGTEGIEDVESYMALLYNFTGWLQETLMEALLRSGPARS